MRIVITGATSFVGAATVRELLGRGHTVFAVVRPGSGKLDCITKENEQALANGRLFVVENDLNEPERLLTVLPDLVGSTAICDVFCHFGWGGSGSGSRTDEALQKKNCEVTLGTMRTAKKLGCRRFLFSGSQAEYGLHRALITEESLCEPRSLYGAAKLSVRRDGERLCRELGMQYIHTRIFSAYGPGDHPWTLVESALDAFLEDRELALGACTQLWNFLYIKDLARAMAALMEVPEKDLEDLGNPVFNLAGEETRVLRDFVEEIHALCNGRGSCRYNTRQENAEGLINLNPSIEKLETVTGWRPETDFKAGIEALLRGRKEGRKEAETNKVLTNMK